MRAPTYQPQTNAPSGSQTRLVAPDTGGLGRGIAGGLQAAARGLGQYAEAELQIQERHNDTHARKLALEYEKAKAPILTQYGTLQGEDAIREQPNVTQQLQKLRDDLARRAGNERMRNLFETRIDEVLVRDINSTIEYSSKAAFKMDLDVTRGEIENNALVAATNYADPLAHATALVKVEQSARREADLLGLTGASLDAAVRDRVSAAVFGTFTAMASDPAFLESKMMGYFDAMQGQMTLDHRNKAINALQVPIRNREADALISDLASGLIDFNETASGNPVAGADAGEGVSSSTPTGSAPRQRPVDAAVGSRFGEPRASGPHRGADFPAPAGTPIKATADGDVTEVGLDPGSANGYFVRVKHPDGYETAYLHMNTPPKVSVGDRVTHSTQLGVVGSTGRSTGPHLHLQVKGPDGNVEDPEEYLKGSTPLGSPEDPQKWDRASMYQQIDRLQAEGRISPEQADWTRNRLDKRIQRDDQIIATQEQGAVDAINDWLIDSGNLNTFTSIDQLPANLRGLPGFTNDVYLKYKGVASANANSISAGKNEVSGSAVLSMINGRLAEDPDALLTLDVEEYAPYLTDTQFQGLREKKTKAVAERATGKLTFDTVAAAGITSAINRGTKQDGYDLPEGSEARGRVADVSYKFLLQRFEQGGGKPLKPSDFDDAYRYATEQVTAKRQGWTGEYKEKMARFRIGSEFQDARKTRTSDEAQRRADRARAVKVDEAQDTFVKEYGRPPHGGYNGLEFKAFLEGLGIR